MDDPGTTAAARDGDLPSARDADAPTGTGRWVESSWDLRQGLTVCEGLPTDAGLDEWIEAELRSTSLDPAVQPSGAVRRATTRA